MVQPKMGGQAVTRLFIKGNEDLANALLSKANGGSQLEAGVNEKIAENFNGRFQIEATVESAGRIELLHQQLNGVGLPEDAQAIGLTEALTSQFDSQIFTEEIDLLVFSIQPDLSATLWRHHDDGTLVCPPENWQSAWTQEQADWLTNNYSEVKQASADDYKTYLMSLIKALKDKTSAHIVMFGCCSFDPAPEPHNFSHLEDTLTIMTNRLNLAMLEASFAEGITFIDVDRILAEIGCEHNVIKRFQYSQMAYEAIRDEFVRVITDVGFFEERPLLVQMGHRSR